MTQENHSPQPLTTPRLIAVHGFGAGAGGAGLRGPLLRLATDEVARALSSFPGLLARPHHMIDAAADALDPNLSQEAPAPRGDDPLPEAVRFIIHSALPMEGLLARMTRAQGTSLALTGRLGLTRDHLGLTLNLWDVRGPDLLACRVLTARPDALPSTLGDVVGELAFALEAAPELRSARSTARASIGTDSLEAFEACAAAIDRLRPSALGIGAPPSAAACEAALRALGVALRQDPAYETPRLVLAELSAERLAQGEEGFARALLEVASVLPARPLYALLRFEALLTLGRRDEAGRWLDRTAKDFPDAPGLQAAYRRLAGTPEGTP